MPREAVKCRQYASYSAESLNRSIRPEMEWIAPNHLQISFQCMPTMDTQVVRYVGVEITLKAPFPCPTAR